MLTHHEQDSRWLSTTKQPDRIPVDFGGTQTGILKEPYVDLKQFYWDPHSNYSQQFDPGSGKS